MNEAPLIPERLQKVEPPPPFQAAFYKDSGEIMQVTTCPDEETAERFAGEEGLNWLRDAPTDRWCYVDGGEFVKMPAQPSLLHVFDWSTKTWTDPTLDKLRAVAWERIKRARAEAMLLPVETPMGAFDADSESVVKLTAVLASLPYQPAEWTVNWTLADNTVVTLDAFAFGVVATTVLAYGDEVHQIARALREVIALAKIKEEIVAVNWPG